MKPPTGGPITGPISAGIVTQAMASTSSRLVDRAHQHQAADRRHHRAAHALHDAGDDEIGERARQRAADRAEHEHGDGGAEHGARAEAVGGPAARRDEDRERQQIGGDRELERERVGADVGGDRRQRGRDHRRVHVLHEQRDRDDQRDDAVRAHANGDSGGVAACSHQYARRGEDHGRRGFITAIPECPRNQRMSRAIDPRQPKSGP